MYVGSSKAISIVLAISWARISSPHFAQPKIIEARHPSSDGQAFQGDLRCWRPHIINSLKNADPRFILVARYFNDSGLSEFLIIRNVCCLLGRRGACWHAERNFDRCCYHEMKPDLKNLMTWHPDLMYACCASLAPMPFCDQIVCNNHAISIYQRTEALYGGMSGCTPHSVSCAGCQVRSWLEELHIRGLGIDMPRLVPADIFDIASYYYETADALPSLFYLIETLGSSELRDGYELCPAAAVMATLIWLEWAVHRIPTSESRARLEGVQVFWRSVEEAHARQIARGVREHDDRSQAVLNPIRIGMHRVAHLLGALEAVVHERSEKGFNTHFVLPLCWPKEAHDLEIMANDFFKSLTFRRECVLFIYDLCYAFFPPSAYNLANDMELQLVPEINIPLLRPVLGRLPSSISSLIQGFQRIILVPFHEELPTGEVGMILRHLAVHYFHLPEALFFIHADIHNHVSPEARMTIQASISRRQWPEGIPFLYLAHYHAEEDATGRVGSRVYSECTHREHKFETHSSFRSSFYGWHQLEQKPPYLPELRNFCHMLEHHWELIFGKPLSLPENDFGGYGMSQFVISPKAVHRRPSSFWKHAWQAVGSRKNYELLPGTRFVSAKVDFSSVEDISKYHQHQGYLHIGVITERLWHVLFEPDADNWRIPTRLRDPSLPLSLKFHAFDMNPRLMKGYRWDAHEPL